MRRSIISLLACVATFAMTTQTSAAENTEKDIDIRLGIVSKNIKTTTALATMLGIEYLHYHTDTFFMGGAVYTGQLSAGASGAVSVGGLLAGAEVFQFSPVGMTFTLLVGAGGGFSSTNGGGFAVDPSVGFNFKLGGKIRGAVDLGYLWMPSTTTYTGVDITARLVFPIG